jgi:thiol-disulfide isomerase/thioredoxin
MNLRPALLAILSAGVCHAAPLTLRELDFLVRQRTPEAEIVQEVAERRLLLPLDAAAEQTLRQSGASEGLLAALRKSGMALSAEETRTEAERQRGNQARTAQSAAEDAATLAQQRQMQQQIAANRRSAGTIQGLLKDRLVKLDGGQIRPFDARPLANVRIFAFYYAAMWSGPCRLFTPKLIEAYQRLKAQYPAEFEIVFVSADHDEFNMIESMRSYQMPWPAVRFGAEDDTIKQFAGGNLPWLVAVADSGQPLTRNAVDKKPISPEAVLGGIEELLAQSRR